MVAAVLNTARTQNANVLQEQLKFLRDGGTYRAALLQAQANGSMLEAGVAYVHQEYPKMLRISKGFKTVTHQGKDIETGRFTWEASEEQFDEAIVNSAAEERAFLKGEPLAVSTVAAPVDDEDSIEALEARLATMKRKAAIRKEMAELAAEEAHAAAAEATWTEADMKEALTEGGHKVNPKWTLAQLTAEFTKHFEKA